MLNPPYDGTIHGDISSDATTNRNTQSEKLASHAYITPTDPPSPREKPGISKTKTWLAKSADLQPSTLKDIGGIEHTDTENVLVAPWGIHWYTPTSIVFLFIVGVGCALGHHVYYSRLHGTPARDTGRQEWAIRIGTALAFLCRSTLTAAIGTSRKQWSWLTLRKKFITLQGIDAMFGVSTNILYFFNRDMLLRAKLASFMAAVMWIIPIGIIFTPGTIAVHLKAEPSLSACTVPSLQFPYDNQTTSKLLWTSGGIHDKLGLQYEDIYQSPSAPARKAFTIAAFSNRIVVPINVTLDGTTLAECGANCTYGITFEGPAVKCTEKTPWNETDAPWDEPNQFAYNYIPDLEIGVTQQTLYRAQRAKAEHNVLWVGVGEKDDGDPPHVYSCQGEVARYSITMEIRDGSYREPVINTVDFLYPVNDAPAWMVETYYPNWAHFDTLVDILGGDIRYHLGSNTTMAIPRLNSTRIGTTALVSTDYEFLPIHDLDKGIEAMAQMMTASLLSDPTLFWVATTASNCTSNPYHNLYQYTPWKLATVYITAIGFTFFLGALGFLALTENGVSSDTNFSSILLTTRNPTLDRLVAGACLGGNPVPTGMEDLKLKFGELERSAEGGVGRDIGHAAIGVEGEISQIRKRGRYS